MVGAHKIDENTDDLERLRELFTMGFNNSEIARIYRTNSGHSLSRPHIRHIRSGKRWNPEKRSFVMRAEMEEITLPTNYLTMRLFGKDEMRNVVELTPKQVMNMKEQITNIFTNESGGITILIDVKV